ncbi:hypothetical protein Slin14017_G057260 [Septoria linicola]|nr:hypothetical protein Slin14017_G057260 [Septoria linicola]
MRLSTIIISTLFGVLANCCPNVQAQRDNSTYPIAPGAKSNQTATQSHDAPSQTSAAAAGRTDSNTFTGEASTGRVPLMVAGALAMAVIGVA